VTNKIAHRWSKSALHFTWKENPNSAYILLILIRDRPRGRVFARARQRDVLSLSPVSPDEIDRMAQRATLSYNLRPFRFKSYIARVPLSLTYPYITHHTSLFTAWYTYIRTSVSIKIVSRLCVVCWQRSFGVQNRCKFVERFFLSVGVITRGRCSYWSIISSWRANGDRFEEPRLTLGILFLSLTRGVALQISRKLSALTNLASTKL